MKEKGIKPSPQIPASGGNQTSQGDAHISGSLPAAPIPPQSKVFVFKVKVQHATLHFLLNTCGHSCQ